ncbi:UNVERIFIED_CONTAM: DNA excision repair protein CSB [Sesamum angustifolium]|uniref:DNA excision repair protein CSB n=1 Tax=Sesamum angustifolium TaxID=2727405 RepID=A0AAW2IJT6_9LAMI
MDEDEEDRVLLSTLGVTSANPEDIERNILEKARKDADDYNEGAGAREEETVGRTKSKETSSSSNGNLVNKLRAVQVEIDAVTSAVEQLENFKRDEDHFPDGDDEIEQGNAEAERNILQASSNDLTLQHALAVDRLQSLIKTRAQLEKEISDSPRNSQHDSEDDDFDAVLNAASAGFVETERDELVRKGILTPFHKLKGYERRIQEPGSSSGHVASEDGVENNDLASSSIARAVQLISEASQARPTTKMLDPESVPKLDAPSVPFRRLRKPYKVPRSLELDSEKGKDTKRKKRRPQPGKNWRKLVSREEKLQEELDGKASSNEDDSLEDVEDVDDEGPPFLTLEGGLKIPETIFSELFDYQKVGVQWLWELHCQRAGGIIGDEMGLGKTVQILAFLGSLHFSGMYKPSIIICPVTLLRQWRREARKWYPGFHVELLHDSAQEIPIRKKGSRSNDSDRDSEDSTNSGSEENHHPKIPKIPKSDKLLDIEWGYAVLDEGHRIRNPNAEVTLVCKQLQTVHRIIMTGSPIQNKLSELWSLFDFVFPGKLGVLPVFEAEFAVPISVGGYANATPLQVSTAYRCAVVLRDLIMPYLLRRMKVDVDAQLPKKTEHVLFCSLTPEQRSLYRAFLLAQRRMDGLTPVKQRMALIDEFNNLDDVFIFILTTKVGGLGTNLTGGNRVIIDPDWNPSTDMQARERAWRIGQKKDVTVYRLITSGTIEEKVYQRQIYKHFLTNTILKNPQQRRFFKARDMKDLFTLNDDGDGGSTETSSIFSKVSEEVNVVGPCKDEQDESKVMKPGRLVTGDSATDAGCNNMDEEKLNHSDKKADEETSILQSLFDAHGIHSAVNHDAIMNAHDEDKIKLEEHASRVAQRAAEALRQSRILRSQESITVPTWTGKSGAAGAPSSLRRKFGSTINSQLVSTSRPLEEVPNNETSRLNSFAAGASSGKALSSAELLARIKGNQQRAVSDGLEHQFVLGASSTGGERSAVNGHSKSSGSSGVQPELLIRQICTFIQRRGGSTSSASIVDHFKERIPSKDLPLFKNLLKEIATLEKSPDGSSWILKPEYRDQ